MSTLRACQLLELPRSSWYWTQAEPATAPRREAERLQLRERIEALCLEFPGYGYRRVTAQVQREGWAVNHKRVQGIMQTESLQCHVKRSWIGTTQSAHAYRRVTVQAGGRIGHGCDSIRM
ncbi:MAG TPA: IS3 family transposase [Longimicrobium sp.]